MITPPRVRTAAITLFLLCGLGAAPVRAADDVDDGWSFRITPYVWALGIKGDVTVKGQKSEPDVSFSDIFDELNSGVMLEGEVRKGRFGAYANTLFADLGDSTHVAGIKIDPDVKSWWQGFGLFYSLGPWPLTDSPDGSGPRLTVQPYVGGRYTSLKVDIKARGVGEFSGDKDWFEPLFGARVITDLSDNWRLTVLGDVGGFGAGSDFAWDAMGLVGYRFGLFDDSDAQVSLGYRAMHQDYSTGSGSNKFEWDVTLHGPIVAFTVEF